LQKLVTFIGGEILKSDDPLEINFYAKKCEAQKWSVSELKRQKRLYSNTFPRNTAAI